MRTGSTLWAMLPALGVVVLLRQAEVTCGSLRWASRSLRLRKLDDLGRRRVEGLAAEIGPKKTPVYIHGQADGRREDHDDVGGPGDVHREARSPRRVIEGIAKSRAIGRLDVSMGRFSGDRASWVS